MDNFFSEKMETVRALREIIITIIETNLLEERNIKSHNQLVGEVISSFHKKLYYSNGIYVNMKEKQIFIQLTLDVFNKDSIMNDLMKLQKRIYQDVQQLTGIKVSSIDIKIKKIISDEK